MKEPSLLDYIKHKLAPKYYPRVEIPQASLDANLGGDNLDQTDQPQTEKDRIQTFGLLPKGIAGAHWPWRSLSGLVVAIIAQRMLEMSPTRAWGIDAVLGLGLFVIAGVLIAWATWIGEWRTMDPAMSVFHHDNLRIRVLPMIAGLIFALLAFLISRNNLFTPVNFGLLLFSVACLVISFWSGERVGQNDNEVTNSSSPGEQVETLKPGISTVSKIRQVFKRKYGPVWVIIFLCVLLIAGIFRFSNLNQVPLEMNSDHAEKILDIYRLLAGETHIFFPNNGGREALQMYLVAGLHTLTGVDLNFFLLKLVSSTIGFLALPFLYLIGKEIANRRVGLLAMAFAGVAYWPNVLSRLGLRLPFYLFFTAATFYFLIGGIQNGRRNQFILLGLVLGLSLYGYSADRVLPLLVLLALGLFLLHLRSDARFDRSDRSLYRRQMVWFTVLALILAGVIFLPMLRYLLDQPEAFLYRTLTRISGVEQPLSSPAILIFLQNTARALAMFSWSNGEVWTVSIPYRPALETVSGALFWAGVILVSLGYLRRQHWVRLFLLLSIPLLLLPSIMALAFPVENPNLYRTAGAAIPVFLLVGLALDSLMTAIQMGRTISHQRFAWALATGLFLFTAYQGYDLVFRQYRLQYNLSAWNTSEMAQVIKDFTGTIGQVENVWIIGYPYWIDARLVAILSGYPMRNFALIASDLDKIPLSGDTGGQGSPDWQKTLESQKTSDHHDHNNAKLFLLNPLDRDGITSLQQQFPQGILVTHPARIPGKEFLIYYVPSG